MILVTVMNYQERAKRKVGGEMKTAVGALIGKQRKEIEIKEQITRKQMWKNKRERTR